MNSRAVRPPSCLLLGSHTTNTMLQPFRSQKRQFHEEHTTVPAELFALCTYDGRSGRGAAGTTAGHNSESHERGIRKHAALSDRAGNGDAFALGEPGVGRPPGAKNA